MNFVQNGSFVTKIFSSQILQRLYYLISTLATSEVIVHGPPGPPGGVSAVELSSTSGTIVWTDGAIYGRQIESYRIEGRTGHNSTWKILIENGKAEDDQTKGTDGDISLHIIV